MPMDLSYKTFDEALRGLKAQGLNFSGINTASIATQEMELGLLSARTMAASVANRAIKAVEAGTSPGLAVREAMQQMTAQIEGAFDTNLRIAYGHGRYKRATEGEGVDFITYRTKRDGLVRPAHARLNGTTLPRTHKFWLTHFAPLGFRCRCITEAVSQAQVEERNLTVSDKAPTERSRLYKNKRTGKTELVPESLAPGWLIDGKAPAIDPKHTLQTVLRRKLQELTKG